VINEPPVDIVRLRTGMVCLYSATATLAAVLSNLPEPRGGVHFAIWAACAILGAIPTIAVGSRIAATLLRSGQRSWLASPHALDLLAASVLCHWLLMGSMTYFVFRLVSGYRGLPLSACLLSTGLMLMGIVLPERYLQYRKDAVGPEHQPNNTAQECDNVSA
jgi:hypothetical protein